MKIRDFQRYNANRNYTKHWDLPRWGNALAGEVGEACNIIKKIDRDELYTIDNQRESLAKELGDILAYLCLLANKAGIDLQSAAGKKFNEVSRRNNLDHFIPETEFGDESAQQRQSRE